MINSNLFQASFTDVFGVQHDQAVCLITSISRNENAAFVDAGEAQSSSSYCNYQVKYWHSVAAKESGARSQEYLNQNGDNTFYLELDGADSSLRDLPPLCSEHFKGKVLTVQEQ